jgi:aryl-alcohol dehydrogenase-like predicted oxidoreductase
MFAWQFCKALPLADQHGWTRFISMQPHYNLINREEEREMLPLCRAERIGILPWSPLTRGRLARAWMAASTTDRVRQDNGGAAAVTGKAATQRNAPPNSQRQPAHDALYCNRRHHANRDRQRGDPRLATRPEALRLPARCRPAGRPARI